MSRGNPRVSHEKVRTLLYRFLVKDEMLKDLADEVEVSSSALSQRFDREKKHLLDLKTRFLQGEQLSDLSEEANGIEPDELKSIFEKLDHPPPDAVIKRIDSLEKRMASLEEIVGTDGDG